MTYRDQDSDDDLFCDDRLLIPKIFFFFIGSSKFECTFKDILKKKQVRRHIHNLDDSS